MEKYQNDHKIGFQESALSMSLWSSSRCGTSFCSWGRFPNFLWMSSHSVVSPGHIAMATCWNSQPPSDLNRNLEPEASIIPQTGNLAKKLGKKAQSLLDTWLDPLQIELIPTAPHPEPITLIYLNAPFDVWNCVQIIPRKRRNRHPDARREVDCARHN